MANKQKYSEIIKTCKKDWTGGSSSRFAAWMNAGRAIACKVDMPDVPIREAIKLVKADLVSIGMPNTESAWYQAHQSIQVLSESEIAMFIRRSLPYHYIWFFVVGDREVGAKRISKYAGENEPVPEWLYKTRKPMVERKRKKRTSGGDDRHNASNGPLVEFRICGSESEEEIEDMIASILSASRRLGHAYSNVVKRALKRVQDMAARGEG